jgi:outer membrane protein
MASRRWWIGIVLGAALLLTGGMTRAQAAQALKIGVVDVQQVLNQSQRGQGLKQKLDQERSGRQKELDAKQSELAKLQAEFEKQAPVLSDQAKRERSENLQKKVRDVRRMAEDANRELEKRVREAEMDVTREIFVVIQEYGKDQGYSLVLERSSIIHSASSVDMTAEIIKRFDSKTK